MKEWYLADNADQIDSPALLVYPSRVKQNIDTLVGMANDVSRLRPHVKTHKSPDVSRMLLEAGITKFKCATIAEAEMLAMSGAEDVLLAYQPLGPKLRRMMALIRNYPQTRFSCLVDHPVALTEINSMACANLLQLQIYIDLNTGMNRTGICIGNARKLWEKAERLKGVKIIGLHAYDGHLRMPDLPLRTGRCNSEFEAVIELKTALEENGAEPLAIVAGGSPTFSIHRRRAGVQCSPGTFAYWDKCYGEICAELAFVPAALLLTRVISLPAAGRVCVDLGHKAVASENDLSKRVSFLNAPGLVPVSQNEEHLVLEAGEGHGYQPGQILYGLPFHICPTVALYERAYTIENNRVTGEWKNIARDRRINY